MPIRVQNNYCVIDFETTSVDPHQCYPIEIAAKIYNSRSLEPIEGAEFDSMCRPPKTHVIDPKVYDITNIKPEEVEKATPIEIIYPKLVDWLLKYNPEGTKWTALIFVGQNVTFFDRIIHERMMESFVKGTKSEKVFRSRNIDLMDLSWMWFENTKELGGYGLNELRKFYGISTDKAHRAMKDVQDTGWIIMRMLKFNRELAGRYLPKMKNAYNKKVEVEV